MLRVALLNGKNKNYDRDFSKLLEAISNPGVISGLDIVAGKIQPGKGFILVTRANTDSFYCYVENTAEVTVDITGTKKIWLEVKQSNIDDGLGNSADGSGIAELKTGSEYPTKNFMKIASVISGVLTDERVIIKNIPNLENIITTCEAKLDLLETTTQSIQNDISKINLEGVSSSSLANIDYMAGEELTKGDILFPESQILYSLATNVLNIGDNSDNTRISFPVIGSGSQGNALKLSLRKFGSPSVDLKLRIEKDLNGVPSGELINTNAIATILTSSLTTSLADITVTLNGNILTNKGIKYHVVLYAGVYGNETINATNYFGIGYGTNNTTTRNFSFYGPNLYGVNSWMNNPSYINSLYRYEQLFTGTTLPTDWTAIGNLPIINNRVEYNLIQYQGLPLLSRYIKHNKNLNSYNKFTLSGDCTGSVLQTGDSVKSVLGFYIDNNNYFLYGSIYLTGTATKNYAKFVVGGITVYENTSSDFYSQIKLEYDGTTIKLYRYITSAWVLYSTYTYTFPMDQNIFSIFTGESTGNSQNQSYIYLDNVYLSNYNYSTQYPALIPTIVNKWIYASSNLFQDILLSRASANYGYKIPDKTRIATKNYSVGQFVKYDFTGISKLFTSLIGVIYYLGNTPGTISTIPGTITYKIGKGNTEGFLYLDSSYNGPSDIAAYSWTGSISIPTNGAGKKIESVCQVDGKLRIKFSSTLSGGGSQSYVEYQIYKNGVAYGTKATWNSYSSTFNYSEDLVFAVGDLIQLYCISASNNGSIIINGFSVCYTPFELKGSNITIF